MTLNYDEIVMGDVNSQFLHFGIGTNTVAGQFVWSNGGAPEDFDIIHFITDTSVVGMRVDLTFASAVGDGGYADQAGFGLATDNFFLDESVFRFPRNTGVSDGILFAGRMPLPTREYFVYAPATIAGRLPIGTSVAFDYLLTVDVGPAVIAPVPLPGGASLMSAAFGAVGLAAWWGRRGRRLRIS